MPSLTGVAIGVVLIVLVYRYVIYPSLLSPLAKVPNAHLTVPILPVWIWWKRRCGMEIRTIYSLHQRYGPVVRIAPNELSVNSIDGLRTIYTGGFEKHDWYQDIFLNYGIDNLVSTLDYRAHSTQKRMLSNVYSKSYLQNSPDLKQVSAMVIFGRLLPLIEELARTRMPVNVLPLTQAVGMDFISAYLFGITNGTDFVRNPDSWSRWLSQYESFKHQHPRDRAWGEIENWCHSLCKKVERWQNEHGNPDSNNKPTTNPVVYQQFRQSLEKVAGEARPRDLIIASEMLDHLVAGHETSGITFTYLMWQISQRLDLQARLHEELLTLSPQVTYPGTSSTEAGIPAHEVDSLPLLDAIVRETLRLHAAAPGPQPRVTPFSPKPTTIDGFSNIPGGVRVSSSAYTLHRNAEVYPEPMKWLPERWLVPELGKIEKMRRLFWAFGSGGRMCLGSNFALQEIKLVTAAIYTNYTTTIVDDDGIEQMDAYIALPTSRKLMIEFRRI